MFAEADMEHNITRLIEESIEIELNMSRLYRWFSQILPDDANLWWELAIEENNHASLLRSGLECFLEQGLFPAQLMTAELDELIATNQELQRMLRAFQANPPSREQALAIALQLEESAGEQHFQEAMQQKAASKALEIFQHLNNEECDHARRIRQYVQQCGIQLSMSNHKNLV